VEADVYVWCYALLVVHGRKEDKSLSGDEIANVNFYAVRLEATRIR